MIALPASPTYRAGRFRLVSNASRFVSPITGSAQSVRRPGTYWTCQMDLPPMRALAARDWAGTLADLVDSGDFALVRPPLRRLGGPAGAPVVDGAGQAGSALAIRGATPGLDILRGTFLAYQTSTFRMLHITTAAAVVAGDGKVSLSVAPAIRKSPANGAAIDMDTPAAEMQLADAAIDVLSLTDALTYGASIAWTEAVRA